METTILTNQIKSIAYEMGFDHVGIAHADFMEPEARRLEAWLNSGAHGRMSYMERHFDKRVDPRKLVPGARSVVSLMFNYFNPAKQEDTSAPKISTYAYGQDYHHVIKKKLKSLLDQIRLLAGDVQGRCFVDSAPVLERDWARRSGLGWVGKHTLLLNKKKGSFFFLAEIILDLPLEPDKPVTDHCGTCTRCIDACPTDAIRPEGYILDASRCISYLTIELREEIPREFSGQMENWMFGCDICQDVCPWNRFSTPHDESAFIPQPALLEMTAADWQEITEDVFSQIFSKSAVKRTRYEGLKRNIAFLRKKST